VAYDHGSISKVVYQGDPRRAKEMIKLSEIKMFLALLVVKIFGVGKND